MRETLYNRGYEMSQNYPHHVGVRFTLAEYNSLQKLVTATGQNQSDVIRFLVRTAALRADTVALSIRREKDKPREPQS